METFKCLLRQYLEELHDAKRYARAYARHKEQEHELAGVCLDLCRQEKSHAEILRHQIARYMEARREQADYAAMRVLWEWEDERGMEIVSETERILETH